MTTPTSRCKSCNGYGKEVVEKTCRSCHDGVYTPVGEQICTGCRGSGIFKKSKDSAVTVQCRVCKGMKVMKWAGRPIECRRCRGEGKVLRTRRCGECNGSGKAGINTLGDYWPSVAVAVAV